MLDFPFLPSRRVRASRMALLLLILLLPIAVRSQAPGLPPAPAVQDEPNQGALPRVTAGRTEAPVSTLAEKMAQTNAVAQMREEIRRAFIKQDYEKVLALSQELRVKYSMEETGNYYVAAAQIRLTEQKALKDGKRPYERINDRPPTLSSNSLPSVEPAPKQVASLPAATPVAVPIVEKPSVTNAGPGEGSLVPAKTNPGTAAAATPQAETPAASPVASATAPADPPAATPATATPAETPAAAAIVPGTPSPQKGDKMIASAAIPPAKAIAPSSAAASIPPSPIASVGETFWWSLLAAAIVVLSLVLFIAMRRNNREEPAEDLAKTLGGLSFETEAPASAPAMRQGGSAPEATARLGSVEAILDEETLEAPKARKSAPSAPAAPKAPAPKAPAAKAAPAPKAPAAKAPERKPAPQPPAPSPEDDPFNFANMTVQMPPIPEAKAAEKKEAPKPPAPEVHAEIDAMTEEIMTRPAINLDDLPPATAQPAWTPADDSVSIEGIGDFSPETPPAPPAKASAALREMEALELPMVSAEVAPEAAETRDADRRTPQAPAAGGIEQTHTSWDIAAERTDGLSRKEMEAIASDLPQMPPAPEAREFHADQTVNLRPAEAYTGDETTESAGSGIGDEQTLGGQTLGSETHSESGGAEDLFDRERREGKLCFDRKDWGGAVHHLSVAAALRPENSDVKEMLREARRMRKSKERR